MIEWDWVPPASAAGHSCLLVVVEESRRSDLAASKVFNIGALVTKEKRVGLKNLHVVDAAPASPWVELRLYSAPGRFVT